MNDSIAPTLHDSAAALTDTLVRAADSAWVQLPDIVLDNEGFVGEARNIPFFETDGITLVFFLYLLVGGSVYYSAFKSRQRISERMDDAAVGSKTTVFDLIRNVTVFLLGMLGYGMTMTRLLNGGTWTQVGLCTAGFMVFMLIKYVNLELFLHTFFPSDRTGFSRRYINMVGQYGLFTLGIFFGIIYLPAPIGPLVMYILLALGSLALCGFLSWSFFATFFKESRLYLGFILYLCTLEIMPLLILGKLLYEAGALTNL
ncbi:MAG: DUF4271 domain-containing protein [Paludibacteraceae bacterium]|nr:DUF4271 domain-containing protein [Paludibacteraceae bacterium]